MVSERVRTGVERLCEDPKLVDSTKIGLATNYAAAMPDLTTNVAALQSAGVGLTALFGPEHGVGGTAQAGATEEATTDPMSGLPLYDTYRHSGAELDEIVRRSGVETVVCDFQDVGARFYTYLWTVYDLMVSAARAGCRLVVLDRPNPIGGLVAEGPRLDPSFASFVGRVDIPLRYGLTYGELARSLARAAEAEAGRPVDVDLVPMAGWQRSMYFDDTGLPWIFPSPNIPTLDTAIVYVGTCLFEGTNLSEGRGTTRPFELIGAPYVDDRFVPALREWNLPGVGFHDLSFVPTFSKHADITVRGAQLHVTDRDAFRPVHTAMAMLTTLRRLYPDEFGWRSVERDGERRYAIDRLWGSDALRHCLDAGENAVDVFDTAREAGHPADWAGDDTLIYS